jgi:hypothetical protein
VYECDWCNEAKRDHVKNEMGTMVDVVDGEDDGEGEGLDNSVAYGQDGSIFQV